ncbi:hypothetical protein OEB99_17025 [Actinotalea sp. M2MS4P-6]|uniref:hypothetical protein n=1 Tax=Actinotalea sp. M2MS4P-6 TaxID=2983762 RepID=UPI0021E3EE5B|nr:hypothetical protein [Actinotalea sp. M2MS4P-6]MCV2396019.1 hypothetical protein [Actinotalea sp. M2MS4P-6]
MSGTPVFTGASATAGDGDGDGSSSDLDPEREAAKLRLEVNRSLLQQALEASKSGDLNRYDEIVDRLVPSDPGQPRRRAALRRERNLDRARLTLAAVLVGGLLLSVTFAIGTASTTAGDYLPLISGLAGIAIGWIYGASGDRGASSDHDVSDKPDRPR